MRAALYARVSSDHQRETQTVDSQLSALRQFAAEQGWVLEKQHVYVDDGESGFYFDRPALDRLRDAARDGLIDLLLVHDPDRLARRYAYQVLLLEEFERWGVKVRFLKQPPADSPEQQLLVQIQGAISEYERARILERTRRGRLFWARQGRPVCALVPFGYRYHRRNGDVAPAMEVDQEEAEVVRQIFRWHVEDGLNYRQIALRLTTTRVPTPTGKKDYWDPSSVNLILRCETYLGTWFVNRYKREPGAGGARPRTVERPREQWIPISVSQLIEPTLFARAQTIRQERPAELGPRPLRHPETHLLRRLVVCGLCGRKTTCLNSTAGRGHRYYWCRGEDPHRISSQHSLCARPVIMAQPLDELVWRDVVSLLANPGLVLTAWREEHGRRGLQQGEVLDEEIRRLRRQLTDGERQKTRLLLAYEQGAIELGELTSRRQILEQRHDELRRRLENVERENQEAMATADLGKNVETVCSALAKGLSMMSTSRRMELCARLIERIVVDEQTAQVHYRFPVSTPCHPGGEGGGVLLQGAGVVPQLRSAAGA